MLNGEPISIKIERRRVLGGTPTHVIMIETDALALGPPVQQTPVPTLAHPVEVGRLRPDSNSDGTPALLPDDQLEFSIMRGENTSLKKLVALTFDMVEAPLFRSTRRIWRNCV